MSKLFLTHEIVLKKQQPSQFIMDVLFISISAIRTQTHAHIHTHG